MGLFEKRGLEVLCWQAWKQVNLVRASLRTVCTVCLCFMLCMISSTAWSQNDSYRNSEKFSIRGVIKAKNRAVLSSELTARIKRLPFREGQSFTQGKTLVEFDCSLFEAQERKMQAVLDEAQYILKNSLQLAEMNSIGGYEIEIARIKVRKEEAELRTAQLTVSRCIVKAPYSGKVVTVMVNEHESVRAQQHLIEIVDTSELEGEIIVPAETVSLLEAGTRVSFLVDETGTRLEGTIAEIGAVVDPVSQTITARVRFSDPLVGIIPGMSGLVSFPAE